MFFLSEGFTFRNFLTDAFAVFKVVAGMPNKTTISAACRALSRLIVE
jgi:hypothetical protein